MVQNMRKRVGARLSGEESGFTLIELLVVMLIIGLLAAIAIPAFFNQRDKAKDADAKENAHTAQVAMETYATDHNGAYTGVDNAALILIEPTISTWSARLALTGIAASAYTLTVTAKGGTNTFGVSRAAGGTVTYPCTVAGSGGCPVGGWGG